MVGGDAASFLDGATPGLPTRIEAITCYSNAAGWDILPSQMFWGDAFGFVRNSVIVQGIAARFATRQASSEKAGMFAERIPQFAAIAWKWVFPVVLCVGVAEVLTVLTVLDMSR